MTDSLLARALAKASVTRSVVVERNALEQAGAVIAALQPSRACCIVADSNTMRAAGDRVTALLRGAGIALEDTIVLDEAPRVKPRADTARQVSTRLAASGAFPIAVGAGVINDITKYASELASTPYVCVATAASMDGYAASGAAMLEDGFKRTLSCAPPVAVIADLDVIATAPARMATWGYGDLAGKVVAGADWMLGDAAGEDPIALEPFSLVQDHVRAWLCNPQGVAARETEALRGLMHGLIVSGFAMQAHGNSRPASGSDHQLSHLWEMERLTVDGEPASHGACVGIGAVAMLALYEWLLERDVPTAVARIGVGAIADPQRIDDEVAASFNEPSIVASARVEAMAKFSTREGRASRLAALAKKWPDLAARLRAQLVSAATLEHWLRACGGAWHPAQLGISMTKLATDYRRARLIRRRYTVLDVLEDLGWLDHAIDALFSPGGFWAARARSSAEPDG